MIPNHGPMMDFGIGETAEAIGETTARFAADHIAPIAARVDADHVMTTTEVWRPAPLSSQ